MDQIVKVVEEFPEVKLVGRKLGPFAEGKEIRVRPWEVPILEDRGLVEPVEDFSPVDIRKRLIAEEKSSQLEDIPPYFYISASHKLRKLRDKGETEEAKKLREALDSFISVRVRKLSKVAVSSIKPENLPPEEMFLLNRLFHVLRTWKKRLDRFFERIHNEEVGAPGKRIRRSIQGIVRNTADIQE